MGKIRGIDAFIGSQGDDAEPSLNTYGQTIGMPWIYNFAMQGRVYTGGMGIEETHPDGESTLNDLKPTYVLRAPDQGGVVIPLYVRLELTTEGGAAPAGYLAHIGTGTETPIVYTSGTNIPAINALGGQRRSSNATFAHTCTIEAVTSAQNTVLWEAANLLDDLISVEGATTKNPDTVNNHNSAVTIPLYPHIPVCLCRGDMLNFYAETGTSDSKWCATFVWAEVDETIVPA